MTRLSAHCLSHAPILVLMMNSYFWRITMALKEKIKRVFAQIRELNKKGNYTPSYRIAEIFQDEEGDYFVQVQIISKSLAFKAKPEELLAKDNIVDQFSPRDIRTLTYLGYLGINSPKFKILAQRLSESNDKLIFAIKKKGHDKLIAKTADEIVKEKEILENLRPEDAHLVGYTFATENVLEEKKQKDLLKQ
jgi:hypothetical protein